MCIYIWKKFHCPKNSLGETVNFTKSLRVRDSPQKFLKSQSGEDFWSTKTTISRGDRNRGLGPNGPDPWWSMFARQMVYHLERIESMASHSHWSWFIMAPKTNRQRTWEWQRHLLSVRCNWKPSNGKVPLPHHHLGWGRHNVAVICAECLQLEQSKKNTLYSCLGYIH